MPGNGPHRFEFVGEEPLIFRMLAILLALVVFFGLALELGATYVLPRTSTNLPPCPALAYGGIQYHAPAIVCSYADKWMWFSAILFGAVIVVMIVYHKQVRYVYRGRKRSPR